MVMASDQEFYCQPEFMLTEKAGKDLKRHCEEQPEVKQEVPARAEAFQQKAATEDFYGDKNLLHH